jgi:hypothetical protein
VLLGGLAAALVASTLPTQASASPAVSRALSDKPGEVAASWTRERMAAAEPAGELLSEVRLGLLPPAPGERGAPLTVPPSAPSTEAGVVDDLLGGLLRGPAAERRAAQPVPNPSKPPRRAHGKVFFRLGGTSYQCSATAVTSKTRRLVVSAGHCIFDAREGGFANNWMFIPAKDGGSEPFGRWTASRLATTRQWARSTRDGNIANDDVRFDVGFATMRKRHGRRLQNVVGARGIAFNRDPGHFDAFGYPAEGGFSGTEPYVCSSRNLGSDSGPPPRPTRIDCDMTGGASGGGWVIGGGRVNSVTSYGYECSPIDLDCLINGNPEEDKLFGPYFGETIKDLYRRVRRRS